MEQICISNQNQYNQAVTAPFVSGLLATAIGHNGDTPIASNLFNGHLPTEVLSSLIPETVRVLQTLSMLIPKVAP